MALIPSLDSDIYGRRKTVISLWCGKNGGGAGLWCGKVSGGVGPALETDGERTGIYLIWRQPDESLNFPFSYR